MVEELRNSLGMVNTGAKHAYRSDWSSCWALGLFIIRGEEQVTCSVIRVGVNDQHCMIVTTVTCH